MTKSGSPFPPLGRRWAKALVRRFPTSARKRIAREFGVTERSVGNWLAGQEPSLEHFLLISSRLGPSFLIEVAELEIRWLRLFGVPEQVRAVRAQALRLRGGLERLERELAALDDSSSDLVDPGAEELEGGD